MARLARSRFGLRLGRSKSVLMALSMCAHELVPGVPRGLAAGGGCDEVGSDDARFLPRVFPPASAGEVSGLLVVTKDQIKSLRRYVSTELPWWYRLPAAVRRECSFMLASMEISHHCCT